MYITPEFYVKMKRKEEYKEGKLISTRQKIKIEYKDNLIYNGYSTVDFPLYYYREAIHKLKLFIKDQSELQNIIGFPMILGGDTIPVICTITETPEELTIIKYYTLSHKHKIDWNWSEYEKVQRELKPRKTLHIREHFELEKLPMERSIIPSK